MLKDVRLSLTKVIWVLLCYLGKKEYSEYFQHSSRGGAVLKTLGIMINMHPVTAGVVHTLCPVIAVRRVALSIIVAALVFGSCLASSKAMAAGETVGVAFVPYMYGDKRADSPEQILSRATGEMHAINYVFTPRNADDVFQTMLNLRRAGKKVGAIVLSGHAAENNNIILFGGGTGLSARDVDLPTLYNMRNAASGPQRRRLEDKIRMLKSVADVSVPGTPVLILNCYAAKTADGKRFVNNLGNVLVGRNGGSVTASTTVVTLKTVNTYFDWLWQQIRNWGDSGFGRTFVDASWLVFNIAPRSQSAPTYVNLAGNWESMARPGDPWRSTAISQKGPYLEFRNEWGQTSQGQLDGPARLRAYHWSNLGATINGQGTQINWDNGSVWRRPGAGPGSQTGVKKYGPFQVPWGSWYPTGVQIRKGQSFTVKATGAFKSVNQNTDVKTCGPDGCGPWGWFVLKAKIGPQMMDVGSSRGGTANQDGTIELGSPRTWNFAKEDANNCTGTISVEVFVNETR